MSTVFKTVDRLVEKVLAHLHSAAKIKCSGKDTELGEESIEESRAIEIIKRFVAPVLQIQPEQVSDEVATQHLERLFHLDLVEHIYSKPRNPGSKLLGYKLTSRGDAVAGMYRPGATTKVDQGSTRHRAFDLDLGSLQPFLREPVREPVIEPIQNEAAKAVETEPIRELLQIVAKVEPVAAPIAIETLSDDPKEEIVAKDFDSLLLKVMSRLFPEGKEGESCTAKEANDASISIIAKHEGRDPKTIVGAKISTLMRSLSRAGRISPTRGKYDRVEAYVLTDKGVRFLNGKDWGKVAKEVAKKKPPKRPHRHRNGVASAKAQVSSEPITTSRVDVLQMIGKASPAAARAIASYELLMAEEAHAALLYQIDELTKKAELAGRQVELLKNALKAFGKAPKSRQTPALKAEVNAYRKLLASI